MAKTKSTSVPVRVPVPREIHTRLEEIGSRTDRSPAEVCVRLLRLVFEPHEESR